MLTDSARGATSCCRSAGTSTERREALVYKRALSTGKPKSALSRHPPGQHESLTSKPKAGVCYGPARQSQSQRRRASGELSFLPQPVAPTVMRLTG